MARCAVTLSARYINLNRHADTAVSRTIRAAMTATTGKVQPRAGRIPLDAFVRMWNELPGLVGDPDMPLHVLEHALVDEPPLNALVFLSSPT